MRMLAILASVIALSACGALNEASSNRAASDEAARAYSAQLPAVTIIRVPVDANGKELNDQAEMRVTNTTDISEASVASTFETSKAPETTVDELDATTSTESFGWRRCCRKEARAAKKAARQSCCAPRKPCQPQCAPVAQESYSSYSESYSSSASYDPSYNWNMYSPTYYNNGYYYNWNYAQSFNNCGGYNYYRYNSNFSQSYSGYGQAPGY